MSTSEVEREQFEMGLGNVTWWGFSPAAAVWKKKEEEEEARVLLLGAGDGRHILHSLARGEGEGGGEEERNNFHFFVYEQNLMLYARQILFLALLQSIPEKREKELEDCAKTLLEILGNISLSTRAAGAVRSMSKKIRADLANMQTLKESNKTNEFKELTNVDLTRFKSHEIDMLEAIFALWSRDPSEDDEEGEEQCALDNFWDFRLRQLLKDRFDVKEGLFEMDYQLRLVERGGGSVSHKEYCHWRKTGEAFAFNEAVNLDEPPECHTNLTLASGLVVRKASKRTREVKKGYWGDTVTGPFILFGFEYSTEMERTSETRALKYVTSLMRQIFRRSRVGGDDASKLWPRVSFLAPHGAERDLLSRRRYSGHFHSAFVGCSVTHFLQEAFVDSLDRAGEVYVESPLFLLHIASQVLDKFAEHLSGLCGGLGLQMFEEEDEDIKNKNILKLKKTTT